MYTKISRPEQVSALRVGDILKRYPSKGAPENIFDVSRGKDIDTFEIQSINGIHKMIGLVMTGDSVNMFDLPGNIGRLFIHYIQLQEQDIWWV